MRMQKVHSLRGELMVPGDKSISHRAVMLGALAKGKTEITNFLNGADCLSTIHCFEQMGIEIKKTGTTVQVKGNGLTGLKPPQMPLDIGNSGTTARILSGLLCAQAFSSIITGDDSIKQRPMKRILKPLSTMGADITSQNNTGCAPLIIHGKPLKGISYQSPVASAQVKSAILFAGLYASDDTSITEPYLSRNHTELMFQQFGIPIWTKDTTATVSPLVSVNQNKKPIILKELECAKIKVPGDISSAAYFIAAALIVPNSLVCIKNVGINPTRDGILKILKKMGADITVENINSKEGELSADLIVSSSSLKGTTIEGKMIPTLIDEIPVLAVLAAFADGDTIIRDAKELRVKESDRISVMAKNLNKMGADVVSTDDGMIIHGGRPIHGAVIDSRSDHRIAMSFAVAALCAEGETEIVNAECVNISYPDFYHDLFYLTKTNL